MTKIEERRCDVCEEQIETSAFMSIRRTLFGRVAINLYRWGIVNINPADSGWVRSRVDLCDRCRTRVLHEVRRYVEGPNTPPPVDDDGDEGEAP